MQAQPTRPIIGANDEPHDSQLLLYRKDFMDDEPNPITNAYLILVRRTTKTRSELSKFLFGTSNPIPSDHALKSLIQTLKQANSSANATYPVHDPMLDNVKLVRDPNSNRVIISDDEVRQIFELFDKPDQPDPPKKTNLSDVLRSKEIAKNVEDYEAMARMMLANTRPTRRSPF